MSSYRAIMDFPTDLWVQALNLPQSDLPHAVVVEGSWWRAQRTEWRLNQLEHVRELDFPDIFWGQWQGKNVLYACAYGAARTAEVVHLAGCLGATLAVQIGTCGGLQTHLRPGDIVLPDVALCEEGVAAHYGAVESVLTNAARRDVAEQYLANRGHRVFTGTHLTWSTLFAQRGDMIERWHRAGYLSVDMETATTAAVAHYFGMDAVSLLVVWDDLTRSRSFLDPMTDEETAALNKGNASVFEVALELIEKL